MIVKTYTLLGPSKRPLSDLYKTVAKDPWRFDVIGCDTKGPLGLEDRGLIIVNGMADVLSAFKEQQKDWVCAQWPRLYRPRTQIVLPAHIFQ